MKTVRSRTFAWSWPLSPLRGLSMVFIYYKTITQKRQKRNPSEAFASGKVENKRQATMVETGVRGGQMEDETFDDAASGHITSSRDGLRSLWASCGDACAAAIRAAKFGGGVNWGKGGNEEQITPTLDRNIGSLKIVLE